MATLSDSPTRPAGEIRDIPPAMDYASHERTYRRFLHILRWVVAHMLLLLPALYFLVVGGQPLIGTMFLVLAIIALGWGVISTPEAARDLKQAFDLEPR